MKHQEFVRAQKTICKTKNICKRQRKHHKTVTDCAYSVNIYLLLCIILVNGNSALHNIKQSINNHI